MVKSGFVSATATKLESILTIEVVPGSGPPFAQQIAGYLKAKIAGTALAGRTVDLWVNGVYKLSATTLTDGSYGFYSYAVAEGTYSFDAMFAGDATYLDTVASKSCTFAKASTALTISISPTSGMPPLGVTVSGKLTRVDTAAGLGGRTVNAYRTDPTGVVKALGYTTTSTDPATLGNYAFLDTIPTVGTWMYQTEFVGDAQFKGCAEAEAPCPECGHPLEFSEEDSELTCETCGAVLEVA